MKAMPMFKKSIDIKHPGALHEQLGIAKNKKIPVSTLQKLKKSKNAKTRKRANFALNARSFKH